MYKVARFFIHSEIERDGVVDQSRAESRVLKKALLCGDCCDRNQAISLLVLVLVSL